MSKWRARPRPKGYRIDVKAPDGFLLGGWRKICSGGFVRFGKSRWRHPLMIGREGEYVFVHVDCCWGADASFAFESEANRHWNPPQYDDTVGRRRMICDDWPEDRRLEAEAEAWYSQAQLEEIARAAALTKQEG